MFYAYLATPGLVHEVIETPKVIDGHTFELADLYHPAFVAQLVPCPDYVTQGYTYEGETWVPPVAGRDGEDEAGNGNPPPP